MKTKITVICCTPPASNPGMSSVDMAFSSLRRRHALDAEVRFAFLYMPQEMEGKWKPAGKEGPASVGDIPVEYRCLREDPSLIDDADVILYWGDFIHACKFQHHVWSILKKVGIATSDAEARSLTERYFFLSDAPGEVVGRAVVFGATFLFNTAGQYVEDTRYRELLTRFMGGAKRVWMREPYSALAVSAMRGRPGEAEVGVDCSLLLRDEDIDALPGALRGEAAAKVKGKVGVFFGRSSFEPKLMGRFAREVCEKLGREAMWIPWGDGSAFDSMEKQAAKGLGRVEQPPVARPVQVGDLYRMLQGCAVVVSDTYHVCVNAWRLGTPAICVADTIPQHAESVSSGKGFAWRDKRACFYAMYDAMEFFTHAQELTDRKWRPRRVYQLSQLLGREEVARSITARMHAHRDFMEARLIEQLRAMATRKSTVTAGS